MNVAAQTVTIGTDVLSADLPMIAPAGQAVPEGEFLAAMLAQTPAGLKAGSGLPTPAIPGPVPMFSVPFQKQMTFLPNPAVPAADPPESSVQSPVGQPTVNAPALTVPRDSPPAIVLPDACADPAIVPVTTVSAVAVPAAVPAGAAEKPADPTSSTPPRDLAETAGADETRMTSEPAPVSVSADKGSQKQPRAIGGHAHARATAAKTAGSSTPPPAAAEITAVPIDILVLALTTRFVAIPTAPHSEAAPAALAAQLQAPLADPDPSPMNSGAQPTVPAKPNAAGNPEAAAGACAVPLATFDEQLQAASASPALLTLLPPPRSRGSSVHAAADEQDETSIEPASSSDNAPQAFTLPTAWTHTGPQTARAEGATFIPSIVGEARPPLETGAVSNDLQATLAVTSSAGATSLPEHTAAPARRLEVAVNDPVLGHVDVRAEMRGGALYAALADGTGRVASAMPALHQFLQEHGITVHSLDSFSTAGASSSVPAGSGGNSASDAMGRESAGGPGSQQPPQSHGQQSPQTRSQYASAEPATGVARQAPPPANVQAGRVLSPGSISIHI